MNPAINADVCLELVRALSEGRMHHDPRCHYRWQPGPNQREPAHLVEPDYVKMSADAQRRYKASGGHWEDTQGLRPKWVCPECGRDLEVVDGMIPKHRTYEAGTDGQEWCVVSGRV